MTLSRQIIHGGNGYDDPIEVTLTEPANPSLLNRLYPVYEEVGTGNLQAALNASGEIVSRKMFGDAYGDESFSLGGPAIDKVEMRIAKNSSGALSSVDVAIRSTEELVPGSDGVAALLLGPELLAATGAVAVADYEVRPATKAAANVMRAVAATPKKVRKQADSFWRNAEHEILGRLGVPTW